MSNTAKNLKKRLKAPHTLVEAAKKGEYIKNTTDTKQADTPGRHIRRFAMALAAYACIALLLIGSVSFLPRFLDNSPAGTQPSTPDALPSITEAEMQALLDAGGTYADLVERIGERHRVAPTGLTIYEWDLANGKILIVIFSKGVAPENLRITDFAFSDSSMAGQPIDLDSFDPDHPFYDALETLNRNLQNLHISFSSIPASARTARDISDPNGINQIIFRLKKIFQTASGESTEPPLDSSFENPYPDIYVIDIIGQSDSSEPTLTDTVFHLACQKYLRFGNRGSWYEVDETLVNELLDLIESHADPEPAPSISQAEMDALIANGGTYADLIAHLGRPETIIGSSLGSGICTPAWNLADGRMLVVSFVNPTPNIDDRIYKYSFYPSTSLPMPIELLSPSEFYNTLCGDLDMIVTSEMRSGDRYLESVYERDGNKVKETTNAGNGERVTYHLDDWQSIVDMYVIGNGWEMFTVIGGDYEVVFNNDHFTLQGDRYAATEAFLSECLNNGKADCAAGPELFVEWYGENPTYEIYFDYQDGTQIFNFRFFAEDGELVHEIVITLTIGDVTVELPEEAD